jgi:DNA topoisomerase-3
MSYTLVIAEKPSVAQNIAAALKVSGRKDGYIEGGGYLISWCVGHLVGLAAADAYGEQYAKWNYDTLPILPKEWQYTVAADKGKQFKILKELMHRADVSEVVNACDAGREGELIFRFVYNVANCKKPMRRLWISSMEADAIRAGFADLKDGADYDALYSSALCRAKADWIIGINATRLFSCLYHKTLNVGRVQTPTLKMLVDREAQIMSFKKEKYHIVLLDLEGTEAASARISDREKAEELKDACRASNAVCVSVNREKKSVAPPKLFDLTTLQREANKLYGYTAKQTLDLAQALYEKRLLTYPRTDSTYLTEDMSETAASVAALLSVKLPFMNGADFAPDLSRVLDSKKVSDHHAIIPTMELEKTELSALPETERNLLSLVGARLLFAAAAPHIYEAVKAIFRCADIIPLLSFPLAYCFVAFRFFLCWNAI